MNPSAPVAQFPRFTLRAQTAGDLMTPNPVSLRDEATLTEAVVLFTDRGMEAAAVVDQSGRPVGVLSRTDILVHEREVMRAVSTPSQATPVRASDLMTPAIFAVPTTFAAGRVIGELLRLKVHQLFVVDQGGVLVGQVGPQEVLEHLRLELPRPGEDDY